MRQIKIKGEIVGIKRPLSYEGVASSTPPNLVQIGRTPTSNDNKNFKIGDIWLDTSTDSSYMLVNLDSGVATWTAMATTTAGSTTFTTDSGDAIVAGTTINILGGDLINTSGAGADVTINIDRGTDGQLMLGASGAAAQWANLTSTGGTVVITEAANSLNIEASGSVTLQFDADVGIATPTAGVITLTGGSNITTTAVGNDISFDVSGTTGDAVQVGDGAGGLFSIAAGIDGEVLTGMTGSSPSFQAIGTDSGLTDGGVIVGQGLVGFAATAAGIDGETLIGQSGLDPVFASIGTDSGLTDGGVVLAQGASAFTTTAVGGDGQVMLGANAAAPAWATLTSTGGTITFTGGANTLNLESIAGGTGLTWSEITAATVNLAVMNGYILNNAGVLTATLPAVAAVGEVIAIVGKGLGGWLISQNAGQTIHLNSSDTTTGAGGSLASTQRYNSRSEEHTSELQSH